MKILIILLLTISCSSLNSKEWGPWISKNIAIEDREWEVCHENKDGPNLHMKGFCWSNDTCRYRKTILGNTRSECRVEITTCLWGDIACMEKFGLNRARLILK